MNEIRPESGQIRTGVKWALNFARWILQCNYMKELYIIRPESGQIRTGFKNSSICPDFPTCCLFVAITRRWISNFLERRHF